MQERTWNCRQGYISYVQILDSLQKIVPFTQNRDRWFAIGQLYPENRLKAKGKKPTNNIFCVQSRVKRNLCAEKMVNFFVKMWLKKQIWTFH